MPKLKFSDGKIRKVKLTGYIHHFGGNTKYYEVIDSMGARHYVLKKYIINFPKNFKEKYEFFL